MQQATDTAYAAAVDAADRRPVVRLRADWAGDGQFAHQEADLGELLDEVEIEQSLVTDLPAEVSQVDGYAIRKLTAKLSGRRPGAALTAAQTFSPLRTDSKLYATPTVGRPDVVCDLGFRTPSGIKATAQFAGPARTVTTNSDGTVTLSALDPADRFRAPVTLPAFVQLQNRTQLRGDVFDLNSQWVIDFIARKAGIYASPSPRPDAIMSVTGHGGAIAELGYTKPPFGDLTRASGGVFGDGASGAIWGAGGPFGMMYQRGSFNGKHVTGNGYAGDVVGGYVEHYADRSVTLTAGRGVGMSGWVYCGPGAARDVPAGLDNALWRDLWALYPNGVRVPREGLRLGVRPSGNIGLGIENAQRRTLYDIPVTGGAKWRFVGIHFLLLANGKIRLTHRIDGVTTVRETPETWTFAQDWLPQAQMNTWCFLDWSCFQLWLADSTPAAGPWHGEEWTPQADIGVGMNWLTYLPDIAGADAWETMRKVVGAEYGIVGFTEQGRFYFKPRSATPSSGSPVKTVTAEKSLLDLSISVSADTVRNHVSVNAQAGYAGAIAEGYFQTEDWAYFRFGGNSTVYYSILISSHVVPLLGPCAYVDPVEWPNQTNNRWNVFSVLMDGGGSGTNVTVYVEQIGPRAVRIRIRNPNGAGGYLASWRDGGDGVLYGAPGLKLGGYKLTKEAANEWWIKYPSSIATYGIRTLPLDSSEWRQKTGALEPIMRSLAADLYRPVPTISDIPVVADPRCQLGDIVAVQDPRGLAPNIVGRLVKTNRKAAKGEPLREVWAVRPFPSTWPV